MPNDFLIRLLISVVNIDSTTLKVFGGIAGNATPLVASAAPEFAYVSFTETDNR